MDNGTRIGVGGSSIMNGAPRMTNGNNITNDAMRLQHQQHQYAQQDNSNYSNNISNNNNINNHNNTTNDTRTANRDGSRGDGAALSMDIESQNKRVLDVLTTDVGVNALLLRLKQSTVSCRDYAGFLKKIALVTEEHLTGIRKVCKLGNETALRDEGRQGSFLKGFQDMNRIYERIADNESAFATALQSMHEDLMELVNNTERGRKHWKQATSNTEKRGPEAITAMQKAKTKYDNLAEEFERSRSGNSKNKSFSFTGPRSGAHHDEELRRKLEIADTDYNRQVIQTNGVLNELHNASRPQAVRALRDLIRECDSGLTLQMQRFGSLNETLLVKNAHCVTPIPTENGQNEAIGMRGVLDTVDNERDFREFILGFANKVPNDVRHTDYQYIRHPSHTNALQIIQQEAAEAITQRQLAEQQNRQPIPSHDNQVNPATFTSQNLGNYTTPPTNIQSSNIYSKQLPPPQSDRQQNIQPPLMGSHNSKNNTIGQQSQPLPGRGAQDQQPPITQPRRPVFGVPLEDLLARDGNAVPMVVIQCMQAVDLYGLDVEGIYRTAGKNTDVQAIKNIFDNDPSQVDFRNPEHFFHDVNNAASTLKLFFRELPDPLLTRALYSEFIEAAKIDDDNNRRDTLHGLINRLPDANYATIRHLILHLNRVQQRSEVNKMGCWNLAICFGPTLLGGTTNKNIENTNWQNRVVSTILNYTLEIFDDD